MATIGSVKFSFRSNTLNAYYAPGGEVPGAYIQTFATTTEATVIDFNTSGCIGGKALDLDGKAGGSGQYLVYPGIKNSPDSFSPSDVDGGYTFATRLYFPYGAAPNFNNSLYTIGGRTNALFACLAVSQQPSGQLVSTLRNEIGQIIYSGTVSASLNVTNTSFYDLVVRVGNTATSNFDFFLDGATAASIGVSRGFATGTNVNIYQWPIDAISPGTYLNSTGTEVYYNEMVLFNRYLSAASIASAFPGASRTEFYGGSSLPKVQPLSSVIPVPADVKNGVVYNDEGNTLTGAFVFPQSTDPGVANVAVGTEYIINDSTLTGTLQVPVASTGTADTVPLNELKEQIRYVLNLNNTSTGAPVQDLSENLQRKVVGVLKVNPEKIRPSDNILPCVTVFIDSKETRPDTIARNSMNGKRRAEVDLKIVGLVYEPFTTNYNEDPADNDLENLMENVEKVLRGYDTFGGNAKWNFPTEVTYHSLGYDEQNHYRGAIMDLKATVYY